MLLADPPEGTSDGGKALQAEASHKPAILPRRGGTVLGGCLHTLRDQGSSLGCRETGRTFEASQTTVRGVGTAGYVS